MASKVAYCAWAQMCAIGNLWDNLLHKGLAGKRYSEAEARNWLTLHAERLFTKEAYCIFREYLEKTIILEKENNNGMQAEEKLQTNTRCREEGLIHAD